MIQEIIKLRDSYDEQHPKYWAIHEVLDLVNKSFPVDESQPRLAAIRLIEIFTCYAIDMDHKARRQYAIFSAQQHINEMTTPNMDMEDIVFNLAVAGELSSREKLIK